MQATHLSFRFPCGHIFLLITLGEMLHHPSSSRATKCARHAKRGGSLLRGDVSRKFVRRNLLFGQFKLAVETSFSRFASLPSFPHPLATRPRAAPRRTSARACSPTAPERFGLADALHSPRVCPNATDVHVVRFDFERESNLVPSDAPKEKV